MREFLEFRAGSPASLIPLDKIQPSRGCYFAGSIVRPQAGDGSRQL
jgi:hypothetical protein